MSLCLILDFVHTCLYAYEKRGAPNVDVKAKPRRITREAVYGPQTQENLLKKIKPMPLLPH